MNVICNVILIPGRSPAQDLIQDLFSFGIKILCQAQNDTIWCPG